MCRCDDAWTTVELPTGEVIEAQPELRAGYVRVVGIRALEGNALNGPLLRRIPVRRIAHELAGGEVTAHVRLLSTMRRGTPAQQDAFYQSLATNYREAAEMSSRPCADIGEGLGISSRTVQGWVAEARRRGHLPPGQAGRAG